MPITVTEKRFPIKLEPKQAVNIFQAALKKKGHKYEIKKESLYLTITPYWVCFYDILINKNEKFNRISNQIALNSINNQINEKVVDIFKISKPIIKENLEAPKTEQIQINLKKPIVTKEEAEETIIKYLIYKHNVSKDQISLSGIEQIYVPNWKVKLDKFKLKIDAITGEVNNFEIIPKKEKTKIELIKEVFSEVKEDKKLGTYFKDFFIGIFDGIIFIFKEIIKNYKIILWILLIAILIYLIFL
jgi:hypothetical protein